MQAGRRLDRELVAALERARSRLAVAVAAEAKATPSEHRRQYREIDERVRRCLRGLRATPGGDREIELVWGRALDSLGTMLGPALAAPGAGESRRLSRQLEEALAQLERAAQLVADLQPAAGQPSRTPGRRRPYGGPGWH